jgi:hypothetical protein
MIRAEYFVLRTLPAIASFNPIVLIVGNRRNLLRLWLRTKIRVLRLNLLHLLRIWLLHLGPGISLSLCWPVADTAGVPLTAPVAAAGVADVFAASPFIPFLWCSAPGGALLAG